MHQGPRLYLLIFFPEVVLIFQTSNWSKLSSAIELTNQINEFIKEKFYNLGPWQVSLLKKSSHFYTKISIFIQNFLELLIKHNGFPNLDTTIPCKESKFGKFRLFQSILLNFPQTLVVVVFKAISLRR